MRILINLSTLKKGGGQNVGLNFLYGLNKIENNTDNYYFLVVENSEIHKYLLNNKYKNILVTSYFPLKRIFNEIFVYSEFLKKKIDIIYTYFGYGMFTKKIPQVSGVAVSNIFFPEIKFWEDKSPLKIFTRKMIDYYRIYGIKKASALIFENKTMEKRCHSILNIPPTRTIFISPSFNPNFNDSEINLPLLNKDTTKFLLLCGWQRNKNIMKVPEIAYYLKNSKQPFHFIITASEDSSIEHLEFSKLQEKYDVKDMISIIGNVSKQQLKSLYTQIDFVLLMSKLESFSNNIIESWYFKKPLIINDAQWAKEICQNAAYYIERESAFNISKSLIKIKYSPDTQKEIIKNGEIQLRKYPSILEKTEKEINFLIKIYNEKSN